MPHIVRYKDHGEEIKEPRQESEQYFRDFEERWEHFELIDIKDADYTDEQCRRLEHVKHLPEHYGHMIEDYVKTGIFPEQDDHPLLFLELKQVNKALNESQSKQDEYLLDLEFRTLLLEMGNE